MRKWRPTYKAIYVIPEIHGNIRSLEIILDRVLPLRFSEFQEDKLVFLGDYIDGDSSSKEVLDCMINIKKEYKDDVIMIRGNHEEMMLNACYGSDQDFDYWISNGGINTITSYLNHSDINANAHAIKRNRILDLIPREHLEFIKTTDYRYQLDDYMFFHGGFNPEKTLEENNKVNFAYDYTSSKYVKACLKNKIEPVFKDNFIYVSAHNFDSNEPFIYSRYLMLGGSAPHKLMIFELNSMSACAILNGKTRMYKYDFNVFE